MSDTFTPIGRFAASDPFDVKSTVAVGANYGSETTPQKPGAVYFALDDDAVGMDYVVAVEFRDHLTKVLDEIKARVPKNSDLIEEIPFGTTFKYEGATGYVTNYFRFAGGVMSAGGSTYSDFSVFNEGPTIEIEETN